MVTMECNNFEKINWHRKRSPYNGRKAIYQNLYVHVNIICVYKCMSTIHTNYVFYIVIYTEKNTVRNTKM